MTYQSGDNNLQTRSKTYLAKVDGSVKKPCDRPLLRPCQPFWGPVSHFFIFEVLKEGIMKSVSHFG